MSEATVQGFLKALERSNLLKPEHLAVARDLGERLEAVPVAQELIRRGWLTEWQTRQILSGHTRLFLGRYKLLDVLGEGGMGAVLKAESQKLGRVVALKVMSKQLANDEVALARFKREIEYSSRLNHPNIVKAIDADQVGDKFFLVMEYFEGMDLKALINQYGRLSVEFSCECVRQAALGLQHAADRGIVHRDIKPSNLLVTRLPDSGKPLVKVLDLGLARFAATDAEVGADTTLTSSGQIMGSPDYMSPEQAMDSRTVDTRSDIYSLGITLFHMISGTLPFGGENPMSKLVARMNTDAPAITSRVPDVHPVLVHIIARMLHRDPAQRFQTPGEVAALLDAFVANPSALMQHVTPPKPAAPLSTPVVLTPSADNTLNLFMDQLGSSVSDGVRPASTPVYRRKKSVWPTLIALNLAVVLVGGAAYLAMQKYGGKPDAKLTPVIKRVIQKNDDAANSRNGTSSPDGASFEEPDSGADENDSPSFVRGTKLFDTFGGGNASQREASDVLVKWARPVARSMRVATDNGEVDVAADQKLPTTWNALVGLNLSGIPTLTDDEIARIVAVTSLRDLDLSGSQIKNGAVRRLAEAKSLERLNIGNTLVTDEVVSSLIKLKALRDLNLRYTDIGNDGVTKLAGLKSLRSLNLEGTNIADPALESLAEMSGLTTLDLRFTRVTPAGIANFKQQLPNCAVQF